MNSLQPTCGLARTIYRGLLLTTLISLSLLGALVVQWGSSPSMGDNTGAIAHTGGDKGLVQKGLTVGATDTPEAGVLRSRDFGLWGYTATLSAGALRVDLSYKHDTVAELEAYVAMNRERAARLAGEGGDVDVVVTFRKLVSPAQFRLWAVECGIDVESVSLRLSALDGVPGTLTVSGRKGDPLPQKELERGRWDLPPVEGVFSVRGKTTAAMLPDIMSGPQVFLADVTPTLTRLDLIASGVPGAKDVTITSDSPYDMLKKLGPRD